MKKRIYILIFALILLYGCTQTAPYGIMMDEEEMDEMMEQEMVVIEDKIKDVEMPSDWRDVGLTDVLTGETFKISDFDKPVLIESFAVWCPTCKRQQDVIKDLHEEVGDSVISISLDTDPNEDEAKVLEHAKRYGFNWLFAVSPTEVTKALIAEFGISVVNAPGAPVVVVCGDSAKLLGRGVKSVSDLKKEIEAC